MDHNRALALLFTAFILWCVYVIRGAKDYGKLNEAVGTTLIEHPFKRLLADIVFIASLPWSATSRAGTWLKDQRRRKHEAKLTRLRRERREAFEEVKALRQLLSEIEVDETGHLILIEYLNRQGFRHWEDIRVRMRLASPIHGGLMYWFRDNVYRDVVAERWCYKNGRFGNQTYLAHERQLWNKKRERYEARCVSLDEQIDALEKRLGVVAPLPEPAEPKSKREVLQELRVRAAEVEDELLTEENRHTPGPHRKSAGIPKDAN